MRAAGECNVRPKGFEGKSSQWQSAANSAHVGLAVINRLRSLSMLLDTGIGKTISYFP